MTTNEQLMKLYKSKWQDLCDALKVKIDEGIEPSFPLLIDIGRWEEDGQKEDWYTKADLKVMLFGSETNQWKGAEDDGEPQVFQPDIASVESGMGTYENFYKTHYDNGVFTYGSKLHQGFSDFTRLLNESNPDKKISYIWNNLYKFGRAKKAGKIPASLKYVENTHFAVIKEEIKILRPDIIVIFSLNEEARISEILGNATFQELLPKETNNVDKINSSEPILVYRTNHPRASITKEIRKENYQTIVNDIMKHI